MVLVIIISCLCSTTGYSYTSLQEENNQPGTRFFWFNFPAQFSCWYTDGLYRMNEPGRLEQVLHNNDSVYYTVIDYIPEEECWHLYSSSLSDLKLRSCLQSNPSHPPEVGWDVCMDYDCEELMDYRDSFAFMSYQKSLLKHSPIHHPPSPSPTHTTTPVPGLRNIVLLSAGIST